MILMRGKGQEARWTDRHLQPKVIYSMSDVSNKDDIAVISTYVMFLKINKIKIKNFTESGKWQDRGFYTSDFYFIKNLLTQLNTGGSPRKV